MRKLYLEIDGTRVGLNKESGLMLVNPTGFGSVSNSTFELINQDGFYARTYKEQAQGQIVGDLVFFGANPYADYKSFADSILTAEKLVFVYDPNGTEYKADCELSYLTKTELVNGNYLTVPVAFNLKSLWYTEETLTGTGTVSVTSGGQYETAIKVTVAVPLTNPHLTIMAGAETVADVNVTEYTTTGVFEYSNLPNDSHITDGGADILNRVNIASDIYSRTRKAFSVNLTGAAMTVKVVKYWRTV